MINDRAKGHSSKNNHNKKDEEIYNNIFSIVNNSGSIYIDHLCIVIVATKDIDKDEEILMPYGYNYWIENNSV